jgi:hypothetical protein
MAALGTAALLACSFASPALAAPPSDAKSPIELLKDKPSKGEDPRKGDWRFDPTAPAPGPESGLTSTSTGSGGITPLYLQFSPAGCYGRTDYAHQGGVGWVEASVHGVTNCTVGVNQVGVTTSLQKQGYFWWDTMESQSSSRVNSTTSYDATPHWNCLGWGSQNYRGISHHWSVEPSGTYASDTTGMENRFSC